jgi:hypothetical protein
MCEMRRTSTRQGLQVHELTPTPRRSGASLRLGTAGTTRKLAERALS